MTLTLLLLLLFVGAWLVILRINDPSPEVPYYEEHDLQGLDGRDLWKELQISRTSK
jgi:hypothetical protein